MRKLLLSSFLLICLTGLLCLSAAGAEISVSPPDGVNIALAEKTTVSFTLTGADAGISGFNITLTVSEPAVASITRISFADWVMLPMNSSMEQQEIFVMGVDLEQKAQPGDEPFSLFAIDLVGHTTGSATLTVTPRRVEDDLGGRYMPASFGIPISVGTGVTSPTPATSSSGTSSSGAGPSVQPASPAPTTMVTPTYHSTDVIPEGTGTSVITLTEQPLNATTPATSPATSTPLPWVIPLASLAGLAGFRAWRGQGSRGR